MRFPVRDVIPSTRRPVVSTLMAGLVCLITVTTPAPWWTPVILCTWLVAHITPLLVLGETVEDRLGHDRYAGLLVVATALGWWVDGAPPLGASLAVYLAGAVSGAHLAMFPTSRIVVSVWVRAAEVPSVVLPAAWLLTAVSLGDVRTSPLPLAGTAMTLVISALTARRLRRPDRVDWAYLDRAR